METEALKHVGLYSSRLDLKQDNPREIAFAAQWAKEQKQGRILFHLLPNASQRDAEVAATIIQWLGSNVGMSFIEEVLDSSPEVRKFIVSSVKRKELGAN